LRKIEIPSASVLLLHPRKYLRDIRSSFAFALQLYSDTLKVRSAHHIECIPHLSDIFNDEVSLMPPVFLVHKSHKLLLGKSVKFSFNQIPTNKLKIH